MLTFKDSPRARVRFRSDGSVCKQFRGDKAQERLAKEVRVLRFLESRLCPFVPRLIHVDTSKLEIVITHCGAAIQHLSPRKLAEIFTSLEAYGVSHEDRALHNVTYRATDGGFCVIDFELASIVGEINSLPQITHRVEKTLNEIEQLELEQLIDV